MISRAGNRNFLAAHYEWLALGLGLAVLAAGVVVCLNFFGEDAEEAAAEEAARVAAWKPAKTGVEAVDLVAFSNALRLVRNPVAVAEVPSADASFLASERRVLCKCGKAIIGDPKRCPACPACGLKQVVEAEAVLDADGDGLPDEWERKYGLNPADAADANADKDGDGFTNLEEFQAKTDPSDRSSHPDYLDSLRVQLPLRSTTLPFVFRKANKIPAGWRCEFFDPARKDDYGRKGATLTALVGEEIADTGYTVKSFTEKTAKRAIAGGEGLTKTVDASEAVVVRRSDKKEITLTVQSGKAPKLVAVDVQATLVYERGTVRNFEVVPGSEIELNGTKYRVREIKAVGKGAEVTLENSSTGTKRTLSALEQ